ncbi:MAG: hypothetical protein II265_01195, partial [Clostridia bacterium]|nr:hypothetical protein [Clostridia bacterium]
SCCFPNLFLLVSRCPCRDNGRGYIVIEAAYTGEIRETTLSDCYLGKLPESDAPERFDHFRDVLRRLTARHDALLAYPESREECELLEPVIRDVQAILDQES